MHHETRVRAVSRTTIASGQPATHTSGLEVQGPELHTGGAMEGTKTLDNIDFHMLCQVMRGADITDMYSPERVNRVAAELGLVKGLSMDLLTGWDFNLSDH